MPSQFSDWYTPAWSLTRLLDSLHACLVSDACLIILIGFLPHACLAPSLALSCLPEPCPVDDGLILLTSAGLILLTSACRHCAAQ